MKIIHCTYWFNTTRSEEKISSLIQSTYKGMACKDIHAEQLTDLFMVKTGMSSVTFPLPAGHRLDNDEDNRKFKKLYPVDVLETVGGPGFCR